MGIRTQGRNKLPFFALGMHDDVSLFRGVRRKEVFFSSPDGLFGSNLNEATQC
jgi:hypothetical protein